MGLLTHMDDANDRGRALRMGSLVSCKANNSLIFGIVTLEWKDRLILATDASCVHVGWYIEWNSPWEASRPYCWVLTKYLSPEIIVEEP